MNLKVEKINELLEVLDEKKDCMLIFTLKAFVTKSNNEYLSKHSITTKELERTKSGTKRMLQNYMRAEDKQMKKAENIIERTSNCDNCEYSVKHKHTYGNGEVMIYDYADKTDRCKRCLERAYKLSDFVDKREEDILKSINHVFENEKELIKCKGMLNKINYKLKKIRNYATS